MPPQSQSKLRRAGSLGSSLLLGAERAVAAEPEHSAVEPKVEPNVHVERNAEQSQPVQKKNNRARPVDQIDPATGHVVKRWPSGNDAATTLEVPP